MLPFMRISCVHATRYVCAPSQSRVPTARAHRQRNFPYHRLARKPTSEAGKNGTRSRNDLLPQAIANRRAAQNRVTVRILRKRICVPACTATGCTSYLTKRSNHPHHIITFSLLKYRLISDAITLMRWN
jgi:hypothetical protein